jgi:hypothetical protein
MTGMDLKTIQTENLRSDGFGSVRVGEKTAWPDSDGDDCGRIFSFKRTHLARPRTRQAAPMKANEPPRRREHGGKKQTEKTNDEFRTMPPPHEKFCFLCVSFLSVLCASVVRLRGTPALYDVAVLVKTGRARRRVCRVETPL